MEDHPRNEEQETSTMRNNSFEEKRVFSVVMEKRYADRIDRMSFRENRSRSGIINEIVEKYFLSLDGREMETSDEGGRES